MALTGAADLAGTSSACFLPASGGLNRRTAHGRINYDPNSRAQSMRRRFGTRAEKQNREGSQLRDPEARFRRYGADFGKSYFIELVMGVTSMRVQRVRDRQADQLADLAVLNERLAGSPQPWAARHRLEYLKHQREQWEGVVEYLTRTDAAATMATIEAASIKVNEALSDEARESKSVGQLRDQLTDIQVEVEAASTRLALTKARVAQNLRRVDQLKAEAAQLERMKTATEQAEKASPAFAAGLASGMMHGRASPSASPAAAAVSANPSSTAAGSDTVVLTDSNRNVPSSPSSSREGSLAALETPAQGGPERKRGRSRHLHSSLRLEPGLKNHWFPAHFTAKLTPDKLIPFELFGEPWVLFRDETGAAACVKDECAHRACPLSLGKVVDGAVQCPYHGWEYSASGECTHMPSTVFCPGVVITSLPCSEKDGLVWVWPGDGPPPVVPQFSKPPEGYIIHAEIEVEVPVEHGLLMENLLDLAHAPFTHTSTFAKGWPVPDSVKFKAGQLLGGNWEPYPIDMSFVPPCMVLSTIGLAQPGKIQRGTRAEACQNHLHQLHICLPSRTGHTRLLYRMSLDFMDWTRHVPGIQAFWVYIAGQVLGEDLVLVSGQQDRMQRGADTWAHPVAYDKLAIRYRRWRNKVGNLEEEPSQEHAIGMSAGELFSEESDLED